MYLNRFTAHLRFMLSFFTQRQMNEPTGDKNHSKNGFIWAKEVRPNDGNTFLLLFLPRTADGNQKKTKTKLHSTIKNPDESHAQGIISPVEGSKLINSLSSLSCVACSIPNQKFKRHEHQLYNRKLHLRHTRPLFAFLLPISFDC